MQEQNEFDCLKLLASAIIEGACGDYIRIGEKAFAENCRARERLEDFFRSERFRLYTDDTIDPEYLIARLKRKRGWNALIREAIKEHYESVTEFAETFPKSRRPDVRYWLKTSKYPPYFREWENRLGVLMCDECKYAVEIGNGLYRCGLGKGHRDTNGGCVRERG